MSERWGPATLIWVAWLNHRTRLSPVLPCRICSFLLCQNVTGACIQKSAEKFSPSRPSFQTHSRSSELTWIATFDVITCAHVACSRAELNDDKDSPVPCARREENERTREKMQLVRSQMENMSLVKERKTKVCCVFVLLYSNELCFNNLQTCN